MIEDRKAFLGAYKELSAVWRRYPNIKADYLDYKAEGDPKAYKDDIDVYILRHIPKISEKMQKIFLKYYGDPFDTPDDDYNEFFHRYFDIYLRGAETYIDLLK